MGGLLDFLNTDQGRMGLGLLAAAGPRSDGAGFGQRLQEGMGQFDAYKANALKQQMLQAQMKEQMQAQQQAKAIRALAAKFMMPATAATPQGADTPAGNSMGNPNLFSTSPSNAVLPGKAAQSATPAYFDREGFGKAYEALDPIAGLSYQQSIQKDNTPITVAPGASLVDKHTFKPIFTAPKEKNLDSKIEQWQEAVRGGYKGKLEDFIAIAPNIMAAAQAPLRQAQISNINAENDYNLPAPRQAGSVAVAVTTPDGRSYSFPNQAAANNFKLKAGIR